ncbi:MAG TPA: UbiA family prenyltransferase [Saprospiraceae bacterium]|nr:UbiA family prenyltransferase [Saprospiraceae bacterium]
MFFIGAATICTYSLHRYLGPRYTFYLLEKDGVKQYVWKKHYNLIVFGLFSLLLLTMLVRFFTWYFILLVPPSFITLFYLFPFPGWGKTLKQLPYLKTFLIPFVFVWVAVLIPTIIQNQMPEFYLTLSTVVWVFIFVFSITLPFDVRDKHFDKEEGIKTLVHDLGKRQSIVLSIAMLLLIPAIHFVLWSSHTIEIFHLVVIFCVILITTLLIRKSATQRDDLYFYLYLDGSLSLFYWFYFALKWLF